MSLKEDASKAIEAVFSDKSCTPSEARTNLEELQSEIEIFLDGLPKDDEDL